MADLAKTSHTVDLPKKIGPIILFLHLIFITYLVFQINQSEELALAEFKEIRNIAYLIYIGLFTIAAVFLIVKRLTKSLQPNGLLPTLLSNLVVSMMLTTFSYLIATLIIDLLEFINLS